MCTELLTEEGYLVDAVENGQLLLEKLNEGKEKYDLILTDNNMGMPELRGIDVLKKIREDERFRDLPVIVSSGDNVEKIVKELGGVYVAKGGGTRNLLENVKKLINPEKQP
jgi:CheY-like chemotaxis protein